MSYLVVQVFEQAYNNKFRAVHARVATLQVSSYLHTPSDLFLRTLPGVQQLGLGEKVLDLNETAFNVFTDLNTPSARQSLGACIKILTTSRRGKQVVTVELEDVPEAEENEN